MTAISTHEPAQRSWSSMPGWSTVADLTPPELIEARRLKTLRKVISYVLAAVAVICAAGAVVAYRKVGPAEDALNAANAQTISISAQRGKYSIVTNLEGAITSAQQQRATLLASDVDVAALVGRIDRAAGNEVQTSSLAINLTPAGVGSTSAGQSTGTTGTSVGTVTMSGTAAHFTDLADFVTRLNATSGFADVIPTSNSAASSKGGTSTWNLTMNLTDAVYSKRFAAPAPAASAAAAVTVLPANTTGGSR